MLCNNKRVSVYSFQLYAAHVTGEPASSQIILLFRGQDKHQGGSSPSKQKPVNLIPHALIESLLCAHISAYSFLNNVCSKGVEIIINFSIAFEK